MELYLTYIILGAASFILGCLIMYMLQNRSSYILKVNAKQKEEMYASYKVKYDDLIVKNTKLQSEYNDSQIELSRLSEKLNSATSNENRLLKELSEYKTNIKNSMVSIDELKEKLSLEYKNSKALQTSLDNYRDNTEEVKRRLQIKEEEFVASQDKYIEISNKYTELKTYIDSQEKHYKEQLNTISNAKESLIKEFENISNKFYEDKSKKFTEANKSSIDMLLKPLREQIDGFKARVNEIHSYSVRDSSNLTAEIKKVLEIGLKMSDEANNLTKALKGDSQKRGAWGEAQLKRTLEMSGLIEDIHFEIQSSFKDLEGKSKQTDFLIKLPNNKNIIIDSKVSLVDYERAIEMTESDEYKNAILKHVKSVRKHVCDLAAKDYTNVIGVNSPSFVLMFMPIEPAYIEALKNDIDLFEYAYKKNIILVSHTTLVPILRTVSNLWMIERGTSEAREISEKAGEIYNQVCVVTDHLKKLGASLNTVSNHYNNTITSFAGKQGLYGKVERFEQLSTNISKSLPQLDPHEKEHEIERLNLIAQPIIEDCDDEIQKSQNEDMGNIQDD